MKGWEASRALRLSYQYQDYGDKKSKHVNDLLNYVGKIWIKSCILLGRASSDSTKMISDSEFSIFVDDRMGFS